jgi:DNA mismatch repair protein MutL
MTSAIQPLPTDVVHLIAAGEVIDSITAVVRELVENALDAGATRISISLWLEQWRVRVADNGTGMGLADLQQAAAPHSTSKIHTSQDLWQINSLGFRGEALHSLSQLASLEIASRPVAASEGWQVIYNPQGEPVQVEPVAIAPGTVVTVDRLFANWATRRQALPPAAQQLRAVQSVIHQLALCHPHVTWQVQHRDREWFNLFPAATAQNILPQILREVQSSDLREFTTPALYLLLGLPDRCHRHRPDWVRVGINGRMVQLPELEQTILAGFRRTLPRDRFPVCFVHLQVPANGIDWNRDPAKSEVYLHHLDSWRQQVASAIDQTLRLSGANLSESLYSQRIGKLLKTAETQGSYGIGGGERESGRAENGEQRAGERETGSGEQDDDGFPSPIPLKAIAQVHNRYILAEHPTGVWLIEQHIAHERVLYEQLCDRWQIVSLESPIILNGLTVAQVEQLQRLGLDIEPFGEQTWVVRSAPEPLAQRQDCADALLELSLGGDLRSAQVATACRTAIRNGMPLTLPQMQTLLNQWQQTRNPRTCPHGRPICLTLEESSLSRFFRRHWVIGKSHGI